MNYQIASQADVDLLAEMNWQLIQDEGHRNKMTLDELKNRMSDWLKGEYKAIFFELDGSPVAYALFRKNAEEIHLRQFFVNRDHRRKGIGRQAVQTLVSNVWPIGCRIVLEVLTENTAGRSFWESVGFRDYAVTLEMKNG